METKAPFHLPSPLPAWPAGGEFASGILSLGGGLLVHQVTPLRQICATQKGGPSNKGAGFYAPEILPEGFCVLGHYCQSNERPLNGWVLVAKEEGSNEVVLKRPEGFALEWSSSSLGVYVWRPTPPEGYLSVGFIVSTTEVVPSLDDVRCVRSDLTDQCLTDQLVWSSDKSSGSNRIDIYSLKPMNMGIQSKGVCVGTFGLASNPKLFCLKNTNANFPLPCMPNVAQINAILNAYAPYIYFHPKETYLPSSVSWFFSNGASLHTKGDQPGPINIHPDGSNLPQGGSNDGSFWIDLPNQEPSREKVKQGDLHGARAYVHVKPTLGGTFTDLAIWIFFPFNGAGRVKLGLVTIPLKIIGEHVGDWEHVTLRVSNFTGELWRVYCSQHSGGSWYDISDMEFTNGGNKPVVYCSLHGHAMYNKAGLVLQGAGGVGVRNDTAKSKIMMETGERCVIMAAEYLGNEVRELPWVNYMREWGPKVTYRASNEIKNVEKILPKGLKDEFEKLVTSLPNELLGEEGPTGPKVKKNWVEDEI